MATRIGKSPGDLFIELVDPRQAGERDTDLAPVEIEKFEKPLFVGGEGVVRDVAREHGSGRLRRDSVTRA